ncbi:MAG: hypothetical protein ACUVWA_00820 [Candidatus Oleimicrobiaceae bacterium]
MAKAPHRLALRRRPWLKVAGFALALYLLLLAGGGLLVRLLVPTERVRQAVLATLERTLGRQLAVGEVDFRLFRGITLRDVSIATPAGADSTALPLRSGTIERFVLGYRLLPLLQRRLEITEITLVKPQLDLVLLARPPLPTARRDTSRTGVTIPVTLALHRLEIRQLACTVGIATDTSRLDFGLQGLNFVASGLRLPQGEGQPWEKATGTIALTCTNAPAFFRQRAAGVVSPLEVSGRLNLELAAEAKTLADLKATLLVGAERLRLVLPTKPLTEASFLPQGELPGVELRASLQADVPSGDYSLDTLSIALARQEVLLCRGRLSSLGNSPRVEVEILERRIFFGKLLAAIRPALSDSTFAPLLPTNLSGTLCLAGTRIEGVLPSSATRMALSATAVVDLRDLSFSLPGGVEVAGLSFAGQGTAALDSLGVRQGDVTASISFDRAEYRADTTPMAAAGGRLDLSFRARNRMRELHTDALVKISRALGGDLAGAIQLSIGPSASAWLGTVDLNIGRLPLAALTSGKVTGRVSGSLTARVRGLDNLGLEIDVKADSLAMGVEGRRYSLPPLASRSVGKLRTDSRFALFAVDSLSLQFADVLSAQLAGTFSAKDQCFALHLKELTLHHRALPALLPLELQEQLGEITLAGATQVRASASGNLVPARSGVKVQGKFSCRVDADVPLLGLSLAGGHVSGQAEVTPSLGKATLDLTVGALSFAQLSMAPITDASAHFEAQMPELRQVVLSRGELRLPSLATRAELTGSVVPKPTGPLISAAVRMDLQASDTVRVTDTVKLLGKVEAKVDFLMEDSVASVEGKFFVPELAVYLPANSALKGIRADIPFSQAVDLRQLKMAASPWEHYAYSGPGGLYPALFGPHLLGSVPRQGWLSIDRLYFAGYGADNLRMHLFVGGGKVIAPSLLVDLYEGNFGGSLAVEMEDLDLAQVRYRIEGHLSGVNSALLAARRGQSLEKGVVNANFSFVGAGLDVRKSIEVEGSFRITEIGPKVADNLLQSLDPQGVDAGIRSARFFINHGFKPRLMTFDLRHGHLYPSITLSQPWYFPVRISGSGRQGGKVELARIPVAFFLQMLKQEAVPVY